MRHAHPLFRSARLLVWVLFVMGACSTNTPPAIDRARPISHVLAPRADSAFAAVEASIVLQHGETASGFRPLQSNREALEWRLAAIDLARHSLDLQY